TYAPSATPGSGASPSGGPAQSGTPSTSSAGTGPAAVVLSYFGAINHHNWTTAWLLGGDNLYSSLTALIADYATVSREDVTVLGVSGDTVTAHIRTTTLLGTVLVHTQTFVVKDGVIVSRGPALAL
ncbi:MAG: hypothetical protein WBH47_24510, partial [Streptosporangiaceae bacterium]